MVLTAWCGARWNVSLVHAQIMVTLNVAQKWTVVVECNGLVMLFLCTGETCF